MTSIPQPSTQDSVRIDWTKPVYCLECNRQMRTRYDRTSTLPRHESRGFCGMCVSRKNKDPKSKTIYRMVFDDSGQVCSKCKDYLPYSSFHRDSGSLTGYHYFCGICSTSYKYNISKQQYVALLELNDYKCHICQGHERRPGTSLAIDHDHNCCNSRYSCGECIRGMLCSDCNRGLGFLKDDPDLLLKAHAYLLATTADSVLKN